MAKQNKKFVATTLTAAMVASAVAPVAGAAFTDSIPNYAKDAVGYVTEKGIMNGLGGTNEFGATKEITRAEVAVLLANALGLDTKGKTASFSDVPATHWASSAIAAVVEAGIAKGTDKGFEPAKNITRQEAAVMFANAYTELKLNELAEVSFKDEAKIASWAKDQVAVLASLGIFGGKIGGVFAPTDLISRGEVAALVHRTEVADVRLEIKEVVTIATKVASVSATNLKQVTVTFDGTVDAATAENEDNYSTTAGAIDSAALSEDGKTVTLTLDTGVVMENQKPYKLSVSNVKAGDKVLNQKDIAFSPLDNVLPTVSSVKSLGNKAVKVTFSEPVKNVTSSNFKLDEKSFFGSVTVTGNVVVLKPYDASALSVGDHKLTTSLVEDYANLKSLSSTTDFTVVEDKEGPKVVEATATLEKATLTFNEDIDPETVTATDVYWLSGTTKKYPRTLTVSGGTKLVADFSNNPLPAYETTLYIDSVSDYSSNVNSTKEVKITATVDQSRPSVTDVKLATNKTDITVKFDKAVSAGDKKYFTLTDKDGKVVPVKSSVAADATNKTFTVSTYSALTAAGTYNLKVSGVQDKTALMNTMLDYNTTFTVGDIVKPTILGLSSSNATRSVVITFDKKMDLASISNPANYLIKLDTDGFGGNAASLRTLPTDVEVRPIQDGKAVLLVFPKQIGTTDVSFPTVDPDVTPFGPITWGSVQGITVTGVKDIAGNILANYTVDKKVVEQEATVTTYDSIKYGASFAVQTDQRTIKVKFDQPIGTVSASDFTLTNADGATITSAVSNGTNVVTLTTNANTGTDGVTLAVNVGNSIKTVAGNAVTQASAFSVYDGVAPVTNVAENASLALENTTITLPFSENLSTTTGLPALYASDLVVKDLSKSNGTLTSGVDYTTTVAGKNLVITLIGQNLTSDFSVAVKADAKYIQDANGNVAKESATYQTGTNTGVLAPIVTVTNALTNASVNTPTFELQGAAPAGTIVKVYNDANNNGVIDSGELVIQTVTAAANGTYSATITLAENAVNNWVVTGTNSGVESAPVNVVGTITHDKISPTLSSVTGTVASSVTDKATLAFTSNEVGTYYYLVLAAATPAPTVDEVIAQGDTVKKGTGNAIASANSVLVEGLTAVTRYKGYVVVVDAAGNKSALGTTAEFLTN